MKRLLALALVLVCVANAYAASDFIYGGVNCGQTSRMLNLVLRLTTDNTESTGVLASQVTANYWRQGGSRVSISTTTLANAAVAYSSGGFVEVDGTNMKGLYRFDLPDAALACGSDWVTFNVVRVYGSATYVYYERLGLASAPDVNVIRWNQTSILATPVTANVTQWSGNNVAATQVDANVTRWNGNNVAATQVDANLIKISGSNVSTSSAQLGVNAVNIAGQAAALDANNLLKVDGEDWSGTPNIATRVDANARFWNGTAVIATNVDANVQQWRGTQPNMLINNRVPIAAQVQQNVARANFTFEMTDATTHALKTGVANLGCVRSIDAGGFATGTLVNAAEVGSGTYKIDFGAGDLNGAVIMVRCTGNGADDSPFSLVTYP